MVLLLGTDFAGMESVVLCLKALQIPFRHVFSCDINVHCRTTIRANCAPEIIYDDIKKRKMAETPRVDLYLAGFPCQPFSRSGKKKGLQDKKNGKLFYDMLKYISEKQPTLFILENVQGLLTQDNGKAFDKMLKALNGCGEYVITWERCNTKCDGVPQNRPRVYIVGILAAHAQRPMEFPRAITPVSAECLLDDDPDEDKSWGALPSSTHACKQLTVSLWEMQQSGHKPYSNPLFVEVDAGRGKTNWMAGVAPCFTCSRSGGHWITNRGRRMNLREMFRYHGMRPGSFRVDVSVAVMAKQLGNTMSQNTLERILVRALPAAGLCQDIDVKDRWESGEAQAELKRTRDEPFLPGSTFGQVAASPISRSSRRRI